VRSLPGETEIEPGDWVIWNHDDYTGVQSRDLYRYRWIRVTSVQQDSRRREKIYFDSLIGEKNAWNDSSSVLEHCSMS
jgi:hypothetical protein